MRTYILVIFLYFIGYVEGTSFCVGHNATSQPVIDYCNAQGGEIEHRCCRSSDTSTATFIAIDLTYLNITKVPDFTQFTNFKLRVVDLRSNDKLEPSRDADFLTLTDLDDLLLPEQFPCPGGRNAWEIINDTIKTEHRCMHQKKNCENSTVNCVEQVSYCTTNGPNHFVCLCSEGYYGYKCLRHGTFPIAAFFGPTLGVTFVASVLLFWTQRRHVIK